MFIKTFIANKEIRYEDRIFIILSKNNLLLINNTQKYYYVFENIDFIQNKEYRYHIMI